MVQSTVIKRSIAIDRQKTSVSLEDAFWDELRHMAKERGVTISALVSAAAHDRQNGNLSSHLRLMVLEHLKTRTASPGGEGAKAGHPEHGEVLLGGGETGATPLGARH